MPPTIMEEFSGAVPLAIMNADPDNWEWTDKSRAVWELADNNWQDFKAKWYGVTTGSHCDLLVHPDSPSLSLEPLPPFLDGSMISILVRESYVTVFDRVWVNAMARQHGAIITGQPGVGKTLFQYYFLIRLLQMKQFVLFTLDGEELYFFYHDGVYTADIAALHGAENEGMPKRKSRYISQPELRPLASKPEPLLSRIFFWSLFDIQEWKEPDRILISSLCLPVQTTSPDPSRYRSWEEKQMPLLTGFPLWTRHELAQGLPYQRRYPSLLNALNTAHLGPPEHESDPLEKFPGARAILQDRELDGMSPSVEDTVSYLLEAAIHVFGFSAGDVYNAVFNHKSVIQRHQAAFNIGSWDLVTAIINFPGLRNRNYTASNHILAINPVYRAEQFVSNTWTVDFKSDWVARNLIPKLIETEDESIRREIQFLRHYQSAQPLMRRFLEPLFHCIADPVMNS